MTAFKFTLSFQYPLIHINVQGLMIDTVNAAKNHTMGFQERTSSSFDDTGKTLSRATLSQIVHYTTNQATKDIRIGTCTQNKTPLIDASYIAECHRFAV